MENGLTLDQLREWLDWYRDVTAEKAREHRENNAGPITAWVESQSSLAGLLVTCIDEGRLPSDDDVRMYRQE